MDLLKSQMEYLTFRRGMKTANGTIIANHNFTSIPKSQMYIMSYVVIICGNNPKSRISRLDYVVRGVGIGRAA